MLVDPRTQLGWEDRQGSYWLWEAVEKCWLAHKTDGRGKGIRTPAAMKVTEREEETSKGGPE